MLRPFVPSYTLFRGPTAWRGCGLSAASPNYELVLQGGQRIRQWKAECRNYSDYHISRNLTENNVFFFLTATIFLLLQVLGSWHTSEL